MAEPGQKFLQKLMDGKIHECEYVEPLGQEFMHPLDRHARKDIWVAIILDNHGGYKAGERILCDSSY